MLDTTARQCDSDSDCRRASPSLSLACVDHVCVERDGGVQEFPIVVDDHFEPTGFRGDPVEASVDCPVRATGAEQRGDCHVIAYDPSALEESANYASVTWQSPGGNWGDEYGFAMPSDARSVSFYAWADVAGANAVFGVGHRDGDGFELRTPPIALGTTPRQYWIDVTDTQYDDVANGFTLELAAPSSGAVRLFVDDIVWDEMPPPAPPVDVTFQVDMTARALPDGCTVYVYGTWNDWALDADATMSDADGDDVFTATVTLPVGAAVRYKFAYSCGDMRYPETIPNGSTCGVDGGDYLDRALTPAETATLPTVCFGACEGCDGQVDVTLQVDLGTMTLGAGCTVHAPGVFNDWNRGAAVMTNTTGNVYAIGVSMPAGLVQEYKFAIDCPGQSTRWEEPPLVEGCTVASDGGYRNRAYTASGPITLDPVCFGTCAPCGT
ncbi:hypothetical protein [Sandaracinus amylolyticus]|uniref:hypothetical protein n=1 Tax=Sandaracinus amylolyticus TaxID=927083 RepID=UPI001F334BF5|nr:hypothetical protein [Sandaracinus amylolyticus]